MISFASSLYKDGIIKLWIEAFGDTKETVCDYLDGMYRDDNMVIYTENGEVLSMASILPVSSKTRRGRYVYAVATAKKSRGKGLCREIMKFIDEFAKSRGESFLILVPAKVTLFDFYREMGYSHTVFKPCTVEFKETGKVLTVKEYYRIRAEILSDCNLIEWDEKSLEYILSHGEIRKTEDGAVYLEDGSAAEILSPHIFDAKWTKPYALIKYLEDFKFEKPYFGLAMD